MRGVQEPLRAGSPRLHAHPFLDDVEPIADAVAKEAAADAAAAAGWGARAAYYAAAAREYAGAEGCADVTPSELAASNVNNVLRRAGMCL